MSREFRSRKGLLQGHLIEKRDRQYQWQSVERGIGVEKYLDDGDQHLDRHRELAPTKKGRRSG